MLRAESSAPVRTRPAIPARATAGQNGSAGGAFSKSNANAGMRSRCSTARCASVRAAGSSSRAQNSGASGQAGPGKESVAGGKSRKSSAGIQYWLVVSSRSVMARHNARTASRCHAGTTTESGAACGYAALTSAVRFPTCRNATTESSSCAPRGAGAASAPVSGWRTHTNRTPCRSQSGSATAAVSPRAAASGSGRASAPGGGVSGAAFTGTARGASKTVQRRWRTPAGRLAHSAGRRVQRASATRNVRARASPSPSSQGIVLGR